MDHRGNRLTIDFTGLCVFVTNEPEGTLKAILAQDPKCGGMDDAAAMEDAAAMAKGMKMAHANGKGKHQAGKHDMPMKHRPILTFDAKYLHRFKGKSKMQAVQLPNGDQMISWNLENRIVTMRKWKGAYPERVVRCQPGNYLPPFPRDPMAEMDVRWIPSLSLVTGAKRVLDVYTSK